MPEYEEFVDTDPDPRDLVRELREALESAGYVACGEANAWYGVTCIRPHDHEGQHSGTLMEPHRVWWQPRAVDPERIDGLGAPE